jgi:phospholipase C
VAHALFAGGSAPLPTLGFALPPGVGPIVSYRSIADALSAHKVSWGYYGDQWNSYLSDPYQLNYGAAGAASDQYCNICNPFQYSTSVMTNPAMRANIQDTENLYAAIANGTLPAVSYIKPSSWVDGHAASSKSICSKASCKRSWTPSRAIPRFGPARRSSSRWMTAAAIMIRFGLRATGGLLRRWHAHPMMVVSPFTKPGHISHVYSDHVSVVKFIERNWRLGPVTGRSRDNLPSPTTGASPYVPGNSPAIGDLFDLFDFGK